MSKIVVFNNLTLDGVSRHRATPTKTAAATSIMVAGQRHTTTP